MYPYSQKNPQMCVYYSMLLLCTTAPIFSCKSSKTVLHKYLHKYLLPLKNMNVVIALDNSKYVRIYVHTYVPT